MSNDTTTADNTPAQDATARAAVKIAKPHPMAYKHAPCVFCGCEWRRPTLKWDDDEEMATGSACANPWCEAMLSQRVLIDKLMSERLLLARLAAETPQFFSLMDAWAAQNLRDEVLSMAAARSARLSKRP